MQVLVMTLLSLSQTVESATTTYYFGKTDGKDTISFNALTSGKCMVIAGTLPTVLPQVFLRR